MAGEPAGPLSPDSLTLEEAKARLRVAADRASPVSWVRDRPWQATGLALLAGFLVARVGLPSLPTALKGRALGLVLLSLPTLLRGDY